MNAEPSDQAPACESGNASPHGEAGPDEERTFRAACMFYLAAAFLIGFSVILPHAPDPQNGWSVKTIRTLLPLEAETQSLVHWILPRSLLALWTSILLEGLIGVFQAPDGPRKAFSRLLFVALFPPARMAFSPSRPNRHVWFPRAGWLPVTRDSGDVMEAVMAIPMLIVALLILPVLAVEIFQRELMAQHAALGISLHLIAALIWSAFVVEFIMLLGVAEKKLLFCKQHWVNIVIIILPLVAFLRVLRLTKLIRLMHAGKMIRMYRIRGVYARALRAAVLFNLVERALRWNPEGYLTRLEQGIEDKEHELELLRKQADELREEIAETKQQERPEPH